MLRKWEAKDSKVISLWKKMNQWVYDGFEETNKRLGVSFDKNYFESDTYLLGKKVVEIGLEKNIFYQKEDGSVWIDLSEEGLDEKIILRKDGTAVYMTQDIGTAIQRYDDFNFSNMVYTVGNEQDYHFKVLFLILEKLGYSWASNCYHLSYGMVDLPSGKMKSREGNVVDADELMEKMFRISKSITSELGKIDSFSENEADDLYESIGLGALKYYILKIDPRKRIMFNPEESIDFNGNTGPFIQYTYARINSLINKHGKEINSFPMVNVCNEELNIIKKILQFPIIIQDAASSYNPSHIANYIYDLVKSYNSYYQNTTILVENYDTKIFRLALSKKTGLVIKTSMNLLGISVPNKM